MKIGKHEISCGTPPFFIAELSGNHNHSLDRALELVDAAAETGAQAIKLQTYTADTITIDSDREEFVIKKGSGSPWEGKKLHDLYDEAHTPWEWHSPIVDRAKERGMTWLSSVFDPSSVDFLEELDVPAIKIASAELADIPLLKKAAATGRPMVISTGMATLSEIGTAVDTVKSAGCDDFVLLTCTTSYPAPPTSANNARISHLANAFGCPVGISDHTLGIGVSVGAVALGASVVEKHFTLRRSDGGVDSEFSMEPAEFRSLVVECERAHDSIGDIRYGPSPEETGSRRRRRSLYVTANIEEGEELTLENVRSIRPGLGLPTHFLEIVLGRKAVRALERGTALQWDMVGAP